VLVTGASGFIGGRLCDRLIEDGIEVHAVSRQERTGDDVEWWRVDLSDAQATHQLVAGVEPDMVFHLAGLPSASRDLALVLPTLRHNLVASVNLMVAAAAVGGARVILAGSLEEDMEPGESAIPSSPYAASKQAASAYARMLNALHGLPVVIARIFMVYGPGQTDAAKLIPYLVESLLQGETPQLGSGGRPVDWVYVDDVVDALVTIADRRGLEGDTIDIGSGELVTIRSLAEQVATIIGTDITPAFARHPARERETVCSADAARTRAMIGWRAQTPLGQGLRQTVDWHRNRTSARR
jgi:UDP-glucose 4-epimerase